MAAALRSRVPFWLRRLFLGLLALAFFWSAGWFWVPWLLKPQAERLAGESLGRSVQIGGVAFRPWSLELTLYDVAVRAADGSGDQLHIGHIYANAALASVWRMAPVLDALHVGQPRLQLRQRAPGRYDVDDILQRLAAPSDKPPAGAPVFALFNLSLTDGAVDFHDDVAGRLHTVRGLQLGVPFLSNLPADREVQTAPRLSFVLNGSVFDSSAHSTPFLDSRRTAAHFTLRGLDVRPYLVYWPQSLPMQLRAGVLQADLALEFEQTPAASVLVKGQLGLHGLQLQDAQQGELLQVERVAVDVAELRPLQRVLRLASLDIEGPRLRLERNGSGQLNLWPATDAPAAPAAASDAVPQAPAWTIVLDRAALRDGSIAWRDQLTAAGAAPAELSVTQLQLGLQDLAYPFRHALQLQGSARLGGADAGTADLVFEGSATDQAADLRATVDKVPLALGAPYLAAALKPRLQGELSARMGLAWKAGGALELSAEQLSIARLVLGTAEPAEIHRLLVRDARVDVAARSVDIGLLQADRPRLSLRRDAKGRWMFEDWLVPAAAAPPVAPPASAWRVGLRAVALEGGVLSYADDAAARPVALAVSDLRLRSGPWQLDQRERQVPVELSAAVAADKGAPGRATLRGQLALEPAVLQAELALERLPVQALEPYFGEALNLRLQRADASFNGQLRLAASGQGQALRLTGDLGIDDLRAQELAGGPLQGREGRDLLRWNTLRLRGLTLDMAPGTALALTVGETALSDFYARVAVDEAGRINLQDLVKGAPADGAAAATGPAPNIRFGPIQVQGGRVLFSDRFVKPNYTANLSELQGRLSAFDSAGAQGAHPSMADLTLRGRAEGTASLQVDGKLNPLAKPLALDIRAMVRDLELPPLSPYSVKYAGHGIERGKLSVDLHYEVLPNGQLTARNSLVLNQLRFGDPVPGAPASLPVRLATALLADRNGVIDLNLPIQGSLNDPQFSLGPVIMKAIGNLILKAVTAPFSLLASAFGGGGEELGQVPFAPGTTVLGRQAEQRLDKVAQALVDRPGLKLSVVGLASLQAERVGLQRARLDGLVRGEKRRAMLAQGLPLPSAGPGAPPTQVDPQEYPLLLKALYERAVQAEAPRSAAGATKEPSVAEMEEQLMAGMQIGEDTARNLALQRSVAVRDYLAARQIPLDRLFLGAPRTVSSDAGWAPHAELELATP